MKHSYFAYFVTCTVSFFIFFRKATLPSVVFAGISKNIPIPQINAVVRKLTALGRSSAFGGNYHIIIYDNDSPKAQKDAWRRALRTHGTFVSEKGFRVGPRTRRMAMARNRLLDIVSESPYANYDYLWIQDLDGVCGGAHDDTLGYSPAVFKEVLRRADEWDVVSFRYEPYWDLWAFRHESLLPHNMYGSRKKQNPQDKGAIDKYIKSIDPIGPMIKVQSAFMMTAIHKMAIVKTSRYSHIDENGDADCEHVAFYKGMGSKSKIRMWPVVFCEGDPGFDIHNIK